MAKATPPHPVLRRRARASAEGRAAGGCKTAEEARHQASAWPARPLGPSPPRRHRDGRLRRNPGSCSVRAPPLPVHRGLRALLRRVDHRVGVGPEVGAVGFEALLAADQPHHRPLGQDGGRRRGRPPPAGAGASAFQARECSTSSWACRAKYLRMLRRDSPGASGPRPRRPRGSARSAPPTPRAPIGLVDVAPGGGEGGHGVGQGQRLPQRAVDGGRAGPGPRPCGPASGPACRLPCRGPSRPSSCGPAPAGRAGSFTWVMATRSSKPASPAASWVRNHLICSRLASVSSQANSGSYWPGPDGFRSSNQAMKPSGSVGTSATSGATSAAEGLDEAPSSCASSGNPCSAAAASRGRASAPPAGGGSSAQGPCGAPRRQGIQGENRPNTGQTLRLRNMRRLPRTRIGSAQTAPGFLWRPSERNPDQARRLHREVGEVLEAGRQPLEPRVGRWRPWRSRRNGRQAPGWRPGRRSRVISSSGGARSASVLLAAVDGADPEVALGRAGALASPAAAARSTLPSRKSSPGFLPSGRRHRRSSPGRRRPAGRPGPGPGRTCAGPGSARARAGGRPRRPRRRRRTARRSWP